MAVPLTPEQEAQAQAIGNKTPFGNSVKAGLTQLARSEYETKNAMTGLGQDAKFQYGGWEGGAHEAASRYRGIGDAAQGRQGEVINYGNANASRDMGLGARQQQVNMAQLMADRASGKVPSIAQSIADRDMGRVAAEQTSNAASARGPAALALANQVSAANTAGAQSKISEAAQIAAANERLEAERAAMGAYSTMRGGDQALQGQDAQQAQYQAQINAQQQAQNDAFQLGMTGYETGVQTAQMGGQMNQAGLAATGAANHAALIEQRRARQRAEDGQVLQAVATTAGTGAGMIAGGPVGAAAGGAVARKATDSDERAKIVREWSDPAATSTWGTGPGVSAQDVAKRQAHEALATQETNAAVARPGPMAVAGMEALERRDAEDLGLMRAKDRNEVKLSKREEETRASLEAREGAAKRAAAPADAPAAAAAAPAAAPAKPSKWEVAGAGLKGLGAVFAAPAAPPPPVLASYHMQPIAAPRMDSDMVAKEPIRPAPAAYPDPREQRLAATMAPTFAQNEALLAAGPGVRAAPPPYMDSDDRTKLRAAFMAGVGHEMNRDNPAGQPELPAYVQPGGRTSPEGARYTVEDFHARPENPRQPLTSAAPFLPNERPRPSEEKAIAFSAKRRTPIVEALRETPMAESNRALASQPYTYKPGFAERAGQAPGEPNVGPMAQRMAEDPVAATAVSQDPNTGTLVLDRDKLAKITAGGVADLQTQVDTLKASLLARRLGGRR